MPKEFKDSVEKASNKNIKNIYVHKINSLIKISRDNLAEDQMEILGRNKISDKKIKKVFSETDKTALKLEKNRQSARKARQRKNLYIKLLQNQVVFLKKQLSQSQNVELSSEKYLREIKSTNKVPQSKPEHSPFEDDLDRYISQDHLGEGQEKRKRTSRKIGRLNDIVQEYRSWFVPQLYYRISNLKKPERNQLNQQIIKNAQQEFMKVHKNCENDSQSSLYMTMAFEEASPDAKIINMMKVLNKTMEETKMLLEKVNDVTKQVVTLIQDQEITEQQISDVIKNRMRYLINEMKICDVGDRTEKVVERSLRWNQFINCNIETTMKKIVEFNSFIETTMVDMNETIQQKDLDSECQGKPQQKS